MKWRTLLFATMACLLAVSVSAQQDMPARMVSGTVVSSSSTQLVLDTDTGRRTFDVDAQSNLPTGLTAGSRVEVEYHEMAGGRMHLANARLTTPTTPDRPPTATATAPRPAEPDTTAPAATADDDDDDAATRRAGDLPRTASPLPLIGLLGLLSLAGGVALRRR